MLSAFKDWLPVALWELGRMMRRKDFIIATLLMPVLAVGTGLVVNYFSERNGDPRKIALAGLDTAGVVRAVQPGTLPPLEGYEWITDDAPTYEGLKASVNDRDVEAALLLPGDLAGADSIRFLVRREGADWRAELEDHVREQARLARAGALGLGPDALSDLDAMLPLMQEVTRPEAKTSRGDRVVATIVIVLIVVALFTTVAYMGIAISGEKQARVTEVVISAIRPQSWIDGKIAAYTMIGLSQVVAWAVAVGGVALFLLRSVPPAVSLLGLLITFVFAVVGFAFYTSLFALVMATIKDLQSTTKFQAYLILIPFVPLMIMDAVLQSPEATWVVVFSQLPFFSPMLQPARWAVSGAAPWEILTALVVLIVSLHFMRLAAGHAFRIGMLMYGKELTLPELWRWTRNS